MQDVNAKDNHENHVPEDDAEDLTSETSEGEGDIDHNPDDPEGDMGSATQEDVSIPHGMVLLLNQYEIDFTTRLKNFEHGENMVFRARDTRDDNEYMAVIAPASSVPRMTFISNYKGVNSTHLQRLVASGPIEDGPNGLGAMVFVLEIPEETPIIKRWGDVPEKLGEDALIEGFVKPIFSVLKEFHSQDMIHGAINLKNIFLNRDADGSQAVLGECVSHAPSLTQHVLYETVERSLADPEGRGLGKMQDDLYAFGMCVAIMARGANPAASLSDSEIIEKKIEGGSYSVIIGRERLPAGLTEFLRGTLNDDPQQRWDFEDVEKWLEGRRLSPRQSRVQHKASRPFVFKGRKIYHLRLLVKELADSVSDAGAVLGTDSFDNWFARNIADENLQANVESITERNKSVSKAGSMRDRYVCEMCMALDPAGPIRYNDVAIMPRALGYALPYVVARKESVQPYAQILNYQLPITWISMQLNAPSDAAALASQYESCKQYLGKKMPGYGIERVTYVLSKDAACFSPLLKAFFVYTSEQLLYALERLAERGKIKDTLLDRHMVAFLAVRDHRMIGPHVSSVSSSNKTLQVLGALKTLAAIQKSSSLTSVPALCDLIIDRCKPLIDRINERSLRENLQRKVTSLKGRGDLNVLLAALDDEKLLNQDAKRFVMAQQEFKAIGMEHKVLETAINKKKQFGMQKGRQVAMILATIIGSLIFLMNVVSFVFLG